jgi:hypothetical protein
MRDEHPFFEPLEGRSLWRVVTSPLRMPAAQGEESETWAPLAVVLDPGTGRLIAAATQPGSQWVERMGEAADVDAQASWFLGAAAEPTTSVRLSSTVMQILNAATRHCGMSPGRIGQVILRPRQATMHMPLVTPEGQIERQTTTGVFWLVEEVGRVTHRITDSTYFSAQLLVYSDEDPTMMRGFNVP